ncbi:MAG TPA: endo-1,4-beta-xylanase, partial [Polyangiaceae bacterium]
MYRRHSSSDAHQRQLVTVRWSSGIVLVGAALGLFGCAASAGDNSDVAETEQACKRPLEPTPYSCGYKLESQYVSRWLRNGYVAAIQLTNVSGEPATEFELFADLGGAKVDACLLAESEPAEGGYLFSAPRSLERHGIRQGKSHEILFMSRDDYAGLKPYLLSVNGVACDPTPPTVNLESSGKLFTSSATLKLTATAADNVAVKKVVFLRDGVAIASDTTAPYVLEVPLTSSLNGRSRYTAVAYDMSGNSATSDAKSVLTAIGNKFFGTASEGAADNANLLSYFNQLTPGNAGKWGSVEATRDQMNWAALDEAYNFAQANNIPFKLHTLIWGQQQPAWLNALTPAEQLAEIQQWMAAASARYPKVAMVDVVNEPLHAVPAYSAALGGAGATGWDWVVKSFEMARQYFPNAELLVNDYNVEAMDSWATDYLNVINVLNARGLVDGIGLQAHFLERAELPVVATNLDRFAATGLPIYVSELDVNFANDARQAQRMRDLFTMFWNHPSV